MNKESANDLMNEIIIKSSMLERMSGVYREKEPSKEDISYTRYADNLGEEKTAHIFRHPRSGPYRRINNAELFRVQKPKNHLENLRRSKSFISDKFFPPFDLKESNLKDLFQKNSSNILRW